MKVLKRVFHPFRYSDSGLHIFTVKSKKMPTQYDLDDIGIHARSCNHVHDCCGCVQHGAPWVERKNKRNEWHVTQHAYRNV